MNKLLYFLSALVAVTLFALLMEAISVGPYYRLKDAVIVHVEDDPPWGYVGHDKRTLVKFPDGYRAYTAGNLGKEGEAVKVPRVCGTDSMFGWFSEKTD